MKQDELFKVRHSLSHLLAMAVLEYDKSAKLGIGPVIDTGFYYDFELSKQVSAEDLPGLEAKMKELIKKELSFEKEEMGPSSAREFFKEEPYKLELIDELAEAGEKITVYKTGDFTDLCEGPHVKNTKEINPDSFSLFKIAGAYWKGDEHNKMLTRIYGLAFDTKEELEEYKNQQEEAEKRDHRKLGKELDLFTFSPLVGSGLPLWTPKGTIIRNELDEFVWDLRKKRGYHKVTIPHITKKELYETSGHWDKFSDELFRVSSRERHEYAVKPMNCPFHTQIYTSHKRSYRELPIRYTETTMVYRDEQSGELQGLSRVLSITQDDAHVFCRYSQIEEEMLSVWDMIDEFYGTLGFNIKDVRLSFHDPKSFDKYMGTKEAWEKSETILQDLAKKRGADFAQAIGEAAFYGPKIDFIAKDSLGREWQVATIQLDLNMPERFNLTCKNEKGEEERVAMIHCAIMGSIERFLSVAIEHFGGDFPLWLSPLQIAVLPIADAHKDYAREVFKALQEAEIRALIHDEDDTLGKKIRDVKQEKIPYFVVIGDKEIDGKTVKLESRDRDGEEMSVEDLIKKIRKEIDEKD